MLTTELAKLQGSMKAPAHTMLCHTRTLFIFANVLGPSIIATRDLVAPINSTFQLVRKFVHSTDSHIACLCCTYVKCTGLSVAKVAVHECAWCKSTRVQPVGVVCTCPALHSSASSDIRPHSCTSACICTCACHHCVVAHARCAFAFDTTRCLQSNLH